MKSFVPGPDSEDRGSPVPVPKVPFGRDRGGRVEVGFGRRSQVPGFRSLNTSGRGLIHFLYIYGGWNPC